MASPFIRPVVVFLAVATVLACGTRASAQSAPPAQNYVAAIGTTPFRLPTSTDFTPGASFTLEGWIYLTGRTPFAWIMGKGLATSGTDPFLAFALQLSDDGTKLAFNVSTGAAGSYRGLTSPATLPLRTWTHVAAVMDGTTTRLLVNGQVVATGSAAGAPPVLSGVPFGLGIAYLAGGATNYAPLPGLARQVRVWTVARTAAQISAALGESLPADRAGLFAAWPLDESAGTTARDLGGNNRALTGGGSWPRLAVLEAGPFFSQSIIPVTDNSLSNLTELKLIDFDSDGDLDVVLMRTVTPPTVPGTPSRLVAYRNDGGRFVEATAAVLGNVTLVHPRFNFVGDFNRDGRQDLLIIGQGTDTPPFPGEQSRLLIQSADGRLVDETATRLPASSGFTHGLAVADIDGDGDLDIYMGNINGGDAPPQFYLNNGSGVFTPSLGRIPADIEARTVLFHSAHLVDVNGDGRPDLILGASDSAAGNELLLNDGTGHFVRNAAFALPPKLFAPRGATVWISSGDLNGDGAADLLLGTTGGESVIGDGRTIPGYGLPGLQVLLNRGDGTFYDATASSGITWSANEKWLVALNMVDFNGDGRPDICATVETGAGRILRIWLNRGAGQFVDASDAFSLPALTAFGHAGDVDRDGRVDLVTAGGSYVGFARSVKLIDRALFQAAPDDPGRLANLSVRTQAGTGDQTLITGFALSGAGTKSLLVRAVGPTLAAFGVGGTLVDPFVEIAPLGAAKLTENNDWGGTAQLKAAFNAVGAFPFSTDASKDAALVFSPTPGAYTAKVTGANGGTGVALVEVYDAGTGNAPKLTNVSARTQVGTGGDVLITGFVVSGNVPKKLLIRAVGPTLAAFGVGGTLADPVLEVRPLGSENIVATNDDWRGTAALKAAFSSVGAFGFAHETSKDAAIAVELPPGAYTATVSGRNATTGVALVEVYELP